MNATITTTAMTDFAEPTTRMTVQSRTVMNTTPVISKDAAFFVAQLKSVDRKAAKAVLERAAIVDEALSALPDPDISKLAELSGWSLSKLSKHRTIHKNRAWVLQNVDFLPGEWTVVYQICRLSDEKRKRLIDERKLRPDLTAQELENYELAIGGSSAVPHDDDDALTEVAGRSSKNDQLPASKNKSRVLATIRAYGDVDEERLKETIREVVNPVLKGKPVKLEFPARKSSIKEKNRRTLAAALTEDLKRRLRSHEQARANLTKQDHETLQNAAWQHQHKFKTGRFPYNPTESASVEHPRHPYSITKPHFATRAKFRAWMRKEKIITAYNPIPENPDLAEETCIKFAVEYCEAKTAKARRIAKTALDKLARSKSPATKKHAEKYLQLVDHRGAL